MDKRFWTTVFTLTGTVIGAGILGLPFVFSRAGFRIGMFWLIVLGLIMIYVNLSIGEITLRTKSVHHLPGYAEKYLGKGVKSLVFFALIFGIYSALLAYLIGEGESLSRIFLGSADYAIFFGIGFWAIMTFLLKDGLEELRKLETHGVIAVIVIIIGIFIWLVPKINVDNLSYIDTTNFFFPFGIVLFALLGFSSIPELRREIKGGEKKLKKAIIIGMLIPIVLYSLFSLTFVGFLGLEVPEVATLAFGNAIVLLGIFTMLTSYFVLSFALKDVFTFDLHESKFTSFFFVSIFPLLLYIGVTLFDLLDFSTVLGIGGVVSGGVIGVTALIMNLKAKKKGDRKPEYSIPMNWTVIAIIGFILLAGIIAELFF